MDVTKLVLELNEINRNNFDIVIKLNALQYHLHRITIWYFSDRNFSNFQIEIMNDKDIVFINVPIIHINENYVISTWIPDTEYNALKYSLFKQDDWSPKPMYNHIFSTLSANPLEYEITNHRVMYERVQTTTIRTRSEENLIYFSYLRTSNIGDSIINRLYRMFPKEEASRIIRSLKRIHKTLVFTDNPAERRDLHASINEAEKIIINQR